MQTFRLTCALSAVVLLALAPCVVAQDAAAVPTLAPGDEGVDGSTLEPFFARYSQTLVMGDQSQPAGHRTVVLSDANYPGGPGFKLTTTMIGPATVSDENQFLAASFQPVARLVSSLSVMHQVQVFSEGKCQGYQVAKDGTSGEAIDMAVEGARFDGGNLDLVIAKLPLAEGYRVQLPVFSSDFGPQLANLWSDVAVKGKESVTVGGETYEAWVVEKTILDPSKKPLEMQGQAMPTFVSWLIAEAPYVVKTSMGPMQVELTQVLK